MYGSGTQEMHLLPGYGEQEDLLTILILQAMLQESGCD